MRVGIPQHVPALTVNRLCGSGFQSIISGLQELELGIGSVALCGGSENMSQSPYILYEGRFGTKLGQDLKVMFIANLIVYDFVKFVLKGLEHLKVFLPFFAKVYFR